MRDELEAEQARLGLRKIKADHGRLDEEEEERARRKRQQQQAARQERMERELARERAAQEAEERRQREAAEAERRRHRRQIIQQVKQKVMGWAWTKVPFAVTIPEEAESRAFTEIERELADLPVEETSERELVDAAERMLDRVYKPAIDAQRREQEARRREAEEARRMEEKKRRLVEHGRTYAQDRFNEEGIDALYSLGAMLKLPTALEDQLTGTESRAQVEQAVEEILAPELKHLKREAAERQRRSENGRNAISSPTDGASPTGS